MARPNNTHIYNVHRFTFAIEVHEPKEYKTKEGGTVYVNGWIKATLISYPHRYDYVFKHHKPFGRSICTKEDTPVWNVRYGQNRAVQKCLMKMQIKIDKYVEYVDDLLNQPMIQSFGMIDNRERKSNPYDKEQTNA